MAENPLAKAFEWYKRIIDNPVAIEDKPQPDGRILQIANVASLKEFVREDPKSAQIIIQEFEHHVAKGESGNPLLHGAWFCQVYLLLYDSDEDHKFLRKMAPNLYVAARNADG